MDLAAFCALCFLGGAFITAVFFASVHKEYADGWKAGYHHAEREFQQRQAAARAARFEAERDFRNAAMIGGYHDEYIRRIPLGGDR